MLKDAFHNLSMLIQVLREDKDDVEVDGDLSFPDQVAEDVVHHPLEGHRRVSKPEEHDCQFEQSSIHAESGLFFVSFPNLDVVVSPMNIELHEVLGATKFVNEFGD